MRKGKHPRSSGCSAGIPERDLGELERKIQILRNSVHMAAERPESFWKSQHTAIMAKLNMQASAKNHRPALLWAPIALGLLICLFFFVENSKAPPPDFAAGSDQELLLGIERALSRDYPEALAPVTAMDSEKEMFDGKDSRSK